METENLYEKQQNQENNLQPRQETHSSDEVEKNLNLHVQVQPKPKTPKPKKRKKPKDSTAPKHPLTGYVRYLNDRRESVRMENPNLPFSEITKILASEWSNLPADKKQHYLDAAEQDRERYTKEFNEYKQTEAYKQFLLQQCEKKMKKEDNLKVAPGTTTPTVQPIFIKESLQINGDFTNFDVPIFTEEFLSHNKNRDGELRQLRKSNIEYEEQNAILQKHIENMKTAIENLELEILQQRNNNSTLQKHLENLRMTLSKAFSGVKIPGIKEIATFQNIDNYMNNLHILLLENSNQDINLIQTVRGIISKLEFTG